MKELANVEVKWEEYSDNSVLIIFFRNIIGEKEANELLIYLEKFKDYDKNITINIYLVGVKLFTPVFISNLFLLANHKPTKVKLGHFKINIFLSHEDATTYAFSHITGLLGNSFFADKIEIFKGKKSGINEYEKFEPSFVISDRLLPSLYLTKDTFRSYFQQSYKLRGILNLASPQDEHNIGAIDEKKISGKTSPPQSFLNKEEIEDFKILAKQIISKEKEENESDVESINYLRALLTKESNSADVKKRIVTYFNTSTISRRILSANTTKVIDLFADEDEKKIAALYLRGKSNNEADSLYYELKKSFNKLETILAHEMANIKKRKAKSEELTLIDLLSEKYNFNKYRIKDATSEEVFSYYSIKLLDDTLTLLNLAERKSFLFQQFTNSGILQRILNRPLFFIVLFRLVFINTTSFKVKKDPSKFVTGISRVSLLKSEKELTQSERNCIDKYCKHLEKVYFFIDSLFQGIYELAKNIVEHSSNKHGILNLRLFDFDELRTIKGDNSNWDKYLTSLHPALFSNDSFYNQIIDISITDDGKSGIIDTRHNFLQSLIPHIKSNSVDFEKFNSDINLTKETRSVNEMIIGISDPNEFTTKFYNNYYNVYSKDHFHSVLKKMIGGYGLKIFTANIEENFGCYTCRSFSCQAKSLSNKSYDFISYFNDNFAVINSGVNISGTHYNFVFPVIYKKLNELQVNPPSERISVGDDMFVVLSNYKFEGEYNQIAYNDKILIDSNDSIVSFNYYEHKIRIKSKTETDSKSDFIPVYDFGCPTNQALIIDRSALLRFMVSRAVNPLKNQPHYIIANLPRQAIEGLLDLLILIHKYFDKNTFWSDKTVVAPSVMIFYYDEAINSFSEGNNGLISSLLLAGKDLNEFIAVNHLLSYYQINSVPSLVSLCLEKGKENDANIDYLLEPPFFKMKQPILFDLLIEIQVVKALDQGEEVKQTIFENNVHHLLSKEISYSYETI
jgi:hypothetical protein